MRWKAKPKGKRVVDWYREQDQFAHLPKLQFGQPTGRDGVEFTEFGDVFLWWKWGLLGFLEFAC